MKFGMIVLHVNTNRLTESDSWYGVIISRWRPWRHFAQKSAVGWWLHRQHLSGASSSTFVLVLITAYMQTVFQLWT